jgi:hypothetical protein
MQMEHPGLTE